MMQTGRTVAIKTERGKNVKKIQLKA